MRLSTDPEDPGYHPRIHEARVTVYLNGERIDRCITADEERGYALVHSVDDADDYVIRVDPRTQERCIQKHTVRGVIRISVARPGRLA